MPQSHRWIRLPARRGGKGTHARENPEMRVQLQFKYWSFSAECRHLSCLNGFICSRYIHDLIEKERQNYSIENRSTLLHIFLHFLFILRILKRIVRVSRC